MSIISCHKKKADPPIVDNAPKLPEATHIGANTFGCYINGELFVAASNNYNSVIPIYCSYNSISPNELRIQGSRRNDTVQDNISFITFIDGVGEYPSLVVGENSMEGYANYAYSITSACFGYDHDQSNPGSVYISHLDSINRIISGTFEMDLVNDDCEPNLLKITDGRFDVTY